jgi:AcrR family transcriptional regulator
MAAPQVTARGPGRPRRFEPETERRLILQAAKKLLQENDYEDVNVGSILTESGLSTRSFYRHFASKDELLVAMFRTDAERIGQRLQEQVQTAGSPREGLEAWIDEMLRLRFDARTANRVAIFDSTSARRASGYADAEVEAVGLMVQPLVEVLEAGRASGDFPQAEPARDALTIHALVWNAIRSQRDLDRQGARTHVLRFALAAIGAVRGPVPAE